MSDAPPITHEFINVNNLRFHLATCGDEVDSGTTRFDSERPLALCLHGFPESWYSWRHQLPLLAQLGYRAWAPDLRGYGQTERPPRREDYAIERLLDDVAGLIDASGARSTLLVAHDWGAVIAWYFAMRQARALAAWRTWDDAATQHVRRRPPECGRGAAPPNGRRPQIIERLVIMNVPHPAVMERVIRTPRQLLRSWYVLFFQIPGVPEFLMGAQHARAIGDAFRNMAIDKRRFPDEILQVYRDNAAAPGALTAMLNYYRALVRGGGANRQRRLGYPIIDVPTLMIWGERDAALGKETTYGTGAYVRELTMRYLPNVSHWVQQEAPEVVNAMLAAWLTGQAVPEAGDVDQ